MVSRLSSPRQGPTWIALRWLSEADCHDIVYAPLDVLGRPGRWTALRGIPGEGYSVIGLRPDTAYRFRVRPVVGEGRPTGRAIAATFRTLPHPSPGRREPARAPASRPAVPSPLFRWSGLAFDVEQPVGVFRDREVQTAVTTDGVSLYLLEAAGSQVRLSRLEPGRDDPRTLRLTHTEDVSPPVDEPAFPCLAPDACVIGHRLWMTWHVDKRTGPSALPRLRQRVLFRDLSAGPGAAADGSLRLSSPLEVVPSVSGRSTCNGSLAEFQGGVWLGWLETWEDDQGRPRAMIRVGVYDPQLGALGNVVTWSDCPSENPSTLSLAPYGGELVLFFSDGATLAVAPDTEPLWCVHFDGKRFYNSRILRRLGRNVGARAAALGEQLLYVYQSNASYPGAVGLHTDITLGRLGPDALGNGGELGPFTGYPLVEDMKANSHPDIAVLGGCAYVVYAKRDEYEVAASDPAFWSRPRAYGTYLTCIIP